MIPLAANVKRNGEERSRLARAEHDVVYVREGGFAGRNLYCGLEECLGGGLAVVAVLTERREENFHPTWKMTGKEVTQADEDDGVLERRCTYQCTNTPLLPAFWSGVCC